MLYIILWIIGIFAALAMLRSYYETHHFKIKRYEIKTDKIKKQTTFAFISDLHNCNYGKENEKIIAAIRNEKPDFLVIGGDLIVGKRSIGQNNPGKYFENAVSFLKGISGELPVLYTYGNHETRVKTMRSSNVLYDEYISQIKSLIQEQKITMLNNEVWLSSENNIIVSGLEVDDEAYDDIKAFDSKQLKSLMEQSRKKRSSDNYFHILVSHPPDFFDLYAEEDVDLVLCGHYHGGTIRLPFIGGIISRNYKPFPRYSYGIYEKNGKTMILTGGLGDHTIHFRLFNMPEIVMVTLKN